jgi:hypothetical protein
MTQGSANPVHWFESPVDDLPRATGVYERSLERRRSRSSKGPTACRGSQATLAHKAAPAPWATVQVVSLAKAVPWCI